jgi:hypothetical protein
MLIRQSPSAPPLVLSANPSPNLQQGHLVYSLSASQNPNLNIKDYATGCDGDIGGLSTCTLDLDENGDGRFWGEMKLGVKREYEGKVRGGYAGFRNKVCLCLRSREASVKR